MLPQFLGKEVDDLITELLNPVCIIQLLVMSAGISFPSMEALIYVYTYMHVHVMDVDMQCIMYTYVFLQSVEGSGGLLLSSDGPDLTGAYLLETLGLASLIHVYSEHSN